MFAYYINNLFHGTFNDINSEIINVQIHQETFFSYLQLSFIGI